MQKQMPERGPAGSVGQAGCRESIGPLLPGILQPVVSGSKTWQQIETHIGPHSAKPVPHPRHFQTIWLSLQKGCLLSYPHKPKVQKVSEILSQQTNISFHRSIGIYQDGIRIETYGT